ncbi:hypothetical protein NC651_004628 [Populus alba x Populus x berolinensis]|nr:hypothetical protein NC651_004628 [Populus alba x Populus x berolinensis]
MESGCGGVDLCGEAGKWVGAKGEVLFPPTRKRES